MVVMGDCVDQDLADAEPVNGRRRSRRHGKKPGVWKRRVEGKDQLTAANFNCR